jgi:hypothetical protein
VSDGERALEVLVLAHEKGAEKVPALACEKGVEKVPVLVHKRGAEKVPVLVCEQGAEKVLVLVCVQGAEKVLELVCEQRAGVALIREKGLKKAPAPALGNENAVEVVHEMDQCQPEEGLLGVEGTACSAQ